MFFPTFSISYYNMLLLGGLTIGQLCDIQIVFLAFANDQP